MNRVWRPRPRGQCNYTRRRCPAGRESVNSAGWGIRVKIAGEQGYSMSQPIDWSAARSRVLLDPTVTMLNTGSFGPLPVPVFDRATELRLRLAAGPTDFFVRQAPPLLWES